MSFSNQSMDIDQFPKFSEAERRPLSSKYRPTNILLTLVCFSFISVILTVIKFQPLVDLPKNFSNSYPLLLGTSFFLCIWIVSYHYFADPLKSWALREQDVSYSSGLIFRKAINQPISRIQHIELKRGPVERFVGLATLQVFSAGGHTHTFKIPGLELDTAVKTREFILEHKDLNRHG